MITPPRKIYPTYILIDLVLIFFSFFIPYFFRYNSVSAGWQRLNFPNTSMYVSVYILWLVFLLLAMNSKNLYTTDRSLTIPREALAVALSVLYTAIVVSAIIFIAKFKDFSRLVFFGNIVFLFVFLSAWRAVKRLTVRMLIRKGFHNINVLIVGAGSSARVVLDEIKKAPWLGLRPVGILADIEHKSINGVNVVGSISDFSAIARKMFVDEVVVTVASEKEAVSRLIKEARGLRLGIKIVPENFEEAPSRIEVSYLGLLPLISYKTRQPHPAEFALKRLFDFFVSLFLLVLLLPFFAIIALLIKRDSAGPVLYIHTRAGLKGRLFSCYKFRTMVQDAEQLKPCLAQYNEIRGGVLFKMKKDPRVTPFGAFLRRFSIDELPQLWNVVKGDMSLVGPRPFLPAEVAQFQAQHSPRLNIRPGISGLAQVRGRSQLGFQQWVKWDLWYINNWSFGLDLKILLWTIPAVFKGKGAY